MKINGIYVEEKQPDAVLGGCIEVYENIWPNPQKTIEIVEKETRKPDSGISWQRADTVGQGVFQTHRTNVLMNITYLCEITDNQNLQTIHNQFYMLLLATTNSYAKRYSINEPFFPEHYQLLKYRSGDEYKAHYDSTTKMGRIISALCYLNDDYEGGEIEFVNFNVKIKPKAGMVILFPSNYAYSHIAHPVKQGIKYALVTWIADREVQF